MDQQEAIRLEVDGKFFSKDGKRVFLKAVTYGPFPDPQPDHFVEMKRVAAAGFNVVRVYLSPSEELLDAAQRAGVMVMVGVNWQWNRVFLGEDGLRVLEQAERMVIDELEAWAQHPAVVACYVANEVQADLARWMGETKVREALERIIELVRTHSPHLLVAYSSYPSTEYLEPQNADFTALNVYLEKREEYASYLKRLHHLAGDRPVVISEFGLDSKSLGESQQAEVLSWSLRETQAAGLAGWTCFAWSDRWRSGGEELFGWDFGLMRRDGSTKPACAALQEDWAANFPMPMISVIICVFNGEGRIAAAVESLRSLNYPNYEVIVVDDGSTDGTLEVLAKFDYIKVVNGAHAGLSVARNAGAAAASGAILSYTDDDCEVDRDYLFWLAKAYHDEGWDACGGPNIPPTPEGEDEAVVASAPGAPSHVMLTDVEAEHIPGCHLSVKKEVFDAIGGFRAQYRAAGDDVDFCWRLTDAGYNIGFHGASFVWHRRRTSLLRYLKQQRGYGKAEALLMRDHPEKFKRGMGARWEGCVYTGSAMGAQAGSVIYSGPAGLAGYQMFWNVMMPSRPLHASFRSARAKMKLKMAELLQPLLRKYARRWYSRAWRHLVEKHEAVAEAVVKEPKSSLKERILPMREEAYRIELIEALLAQGWQYAGDCDSWDLQREGVKLLIASECLGERCWQARVRVKAASGHDRLLDDIFLISSSL